MLKKLVLVASLVGVLATMGTSFASTSSAGLYFARPASIIPVIPPPPPKLK
jgi:hypothetical protein